MGAESIIKKIKSIPRQKVFITIIVSCLIIVLAGCSSISNVLGETPFNRGSQKDEIINNYREELKSLTGMNQIQDHIGSAYKEIKESGETVEDLERYQLILNLANQRLLDLRIPYKFIRNDFYIENYNAVESLVIEDAIKQNDIFILDIFYTNYTKTQGYSFDDLGGMRGNFLETFAIIGDNLVKEGISKNNENFIKEYFNNRIFTGPYYKESYDIEKIDGLIETWTELIRLSQKNVSESESRVIQYLLDIVEKDITKSDFFEANNVVTGLMNNQYIEPTEELKAASRKLESIISSNLIAADQIEDSKLHTFKHWNEKFGYKDDDENIVIEPIFVSANSFSNGRALVELDSGQTAFIDRTGEVKILGKNFIILSDFHEGYAPIAPNQKGLRDDASIESIDFINTEGVTVLKQPSNISYKMPVESLRFSDGLIPVLVDDQSSSSAKYGYMNIKGEIVIKPQFSKALNFNDGMAGVSYDLKKYGYVSKNGKTYPPIFIPYQNDETSIPSYHNDVVSSRYVVDFVLLDKDQNPMLSLSEDVLREMNKDVAAIGPNTHYQSLGVQINSFSEGYGVLLLNRNYYPNLDEYEYAKFDVLYFINTKGEITFRFRNQGNWYIKHPMGFQKGTIVLVSNLDNETANPSEMMTIDYFGNITNLGRIED